jgi:beta-phosphoglucomutase-like phosphatase (HAD superfamily)
MITDLAKVHGRPDDVIEDSVNGIVAARHAQCSAVGLITSFHQTQLLSGGANVVVDRFSELREHLNLSC